MTEKDSAYRERVARILADEMASTYPLVAGSVATVANTIKTSAEVSLRTPRHWTAEEESLARSAFSGAFGKVPRFGGGFDEPASLARERRAFENAAIEAALDYREVIRGMDIASREHAAGEIPIEEFIGRSNQAYTDYLDASIDASIARNAKTLKITVIWAAILLVIWWTIVLIAGFSFLIGGVVSLVILGGCTFAYFTFNPYDHR